MSSNIYVLRTLKGLKQVRRRLLQWPWQCNESFPSWRVAFPIIYRWFPIKTSIYKGFPIAILTHDAPKPTPLVPQTPRESARSLTPRLSGEIDGFHRISMENHCCHGWWLTYHLEKCEFVNGKDDIPYMENKFHVGNHQADWFMGFI